jgi:hypothetical protein
MRSLGSLSSGTSSPAWASQFNRLSTRCLRGLARKQPSFVCTSTGASRTGRLDGVLLLLEVKALAHPDAGVRSVCQYPLSRGSFFNERSELLSFGYVCTYGCFISLGLHAKRSLTIVAGKYLRTIAQTRESCACFSSKVTAQKALSGEALCSDPFAVSMFRFLAAVDSGCCIGPSNTKMAMYFLCTVLKGTVKI